MHNELKITDMQTLESNKKAIEESNTPISLDLPDFTTDSYKDAYSRINAIVIEGEQEAHDNYISIATLIPNELLGKNLKELLINHWFKLIMNLMQSDWPN